MLTICIDFLRDGLRQDRSDARVIKYMPVPDNLPPPDTQEPEQPDGMDVDEPLSPVSLGKRLREDDDVGDEPDLAENVCCDIY